MNPQTLYCPACGSYRFEAASNKHYVCGQCGQQYFHNVAAAVAAVITCGDEVLFSVRGREPAKGLWDFPGGFIDPDENLEQGLLRELQEELHWQPDSLPQYLFSGFNTYHFGGVIYKTLDTFFQIDCSQKPAFSVHDDVESVVWQRIADLKPDQLAFDVMREAVMRLQKLGF